MAKEEAKKKMKTKIPTALKRVKQAKAKQLINSAFKSRVRTAINTFHKATESKDKAASDESLSFVYKLVDKCVNRGIYKINKSARIKSRMKAKAL
ncbi:30S ribosomal protein S20 [Candidatus Aerophobetes bacterium]|uniref:Small ribosomal subunit protein bS20 n=1 Tax=Aerophobetes bacterium TaxID=2030807 RepID=A0A2A4X3N2_UNCAE|nr:MAG: 30S ribosomal protein S20 [Candidatus Aerophobetes bacterium]